MIDRETLLDELEKFFSLMGEMDRVLQMPAGAIDDFWHGFLESPEYPDWCGQRYGGTVAHLTLGGEEVLCWTSLYEKKFGPLPQVWFTRSDGSVKEELLSEYRRTGEFHCSWNCTPEVKKVKKAA